MNNKGQKGLTLIELMVVVAIMGVIAAVALPAYRSYIDTANMTKIQVQYEEAVRQAKMVYSKAHTLKAINPDSGNLGVPADAAAWIQIFNPDEIQAPGGGNAYKANVADSATGAIGVLVAGSGLDQTIEILPPAYLEMPAMSSVVVKAEEQS